jgi:hypothetical protein
MRSKLSQLTEWYFKYERRLSTLAFVTGFVIDIFTLRRVDMLLENLWIAFLMLVSAAGIIVLNYFDRPHIGQRIAETTRARINFWTLITIQLAFGSMMSAFLIFYFRSATLAQSWPFLLLLAFIFVSSEIFRNHYSRLVFQISVWFFSVFAFTIFFLPVLMHQIGADVFILSGAISLLILLAFLFVLNLFTHEKFRQSKFALVGSVAGIFILINILYFTHIIPPIPLLLKDLGIYHNVERTLNGTYRVLAENDSSRFERFFGLRESIHVTSSRQLYAYSAIFSPTKLNTDVIHEWQHYNLEKENWETRATIQLSIIGGRDGGFRTFSLKNNVIPGLWRVNVRLANGQAIGMIKFEVENTAGDLELISVVKN